MYMEWMTQEENLFTMQWGIEGENYNVVVCKYFLVGSQFIGTTL